MSHLPFRFTAFDTETTGLKEDARIIEIALVQFEYNESDGLKLVDEWSSFLNPDNVNYDDPGVQQALSVNQIKKEDLAGAPQYQDIFHRLYLHFRWSDIWVAHNAEFDIRMLNQESRKSRQVDFPIQPKIQLCTKLLSAKIHNTEKGHRLQEVAPRWGVVQEGAHRAASDAITCGRILGAMVQRGALPLEFDGLHTFQKEASASYRMQRR